MFTTRLVRERLDIVRDALARRKSAYPLDELLKLDEEWRAMKTKLQDLQSRRNRASLEVSEAKKKSMDVSERITELGKLKEEIVEMESTLPTYEDRIEKLLISLPNLVHPKVPNGESDADNPEVRKWGTPKKKSSPSHEEILSKLDMIDVERAAKVGGARFYILKRDLVLLEQSVLRFALDELTRKGYIPVEPPFLMKQKYYRGAVPLGTFEETLYKVTDTAEAGKRTDYEHMEEDLFLVGTAEHPLAAMHAEEVFNGKELPLKYVGISPCFRREAGAHGKDTKGIFRLHQFNKVEQFIFCKPEDSEKYHEELIHNIEDIMKKLDLPYRVVEICIGDLSAKDYRSFDVEVYMPSQERYRELMSCSNVGDWQSLRLDIKYDEGNERKYVHTLNGTAISAERMLVAIAENYSDSSGRISVPEALAPYMGKSTIG